MKSAIIPDYDNYTIYENGDVYSKVRRGGGGKLTQTLGNNGYYSVALTKNSFTKRFNIHRLLGICFIPNPENKNCIDHIDRDRLNNNLCNLRWATYQENNINKEQSKGYIFVSKRIYKEKEYTYFRFSICKDGKRTSKNFKTIEEAENYKLNLVL
tara:strand:+ start:73 stop:537 length:465 start_codon:yes stop_codon:yes gene_type:complete